MLLCANNNRKRRSIRSVASVALIISVILVLYGGKDAIQSSYGQQAVKTFKIKVQLDKSVVSRGDIQIIRYTVDDASTGQPVSGVVARATVYYADGVTVRQFATTTDASGQASISWKIERNATPGIFSTSIGVSAAVYVGESFNKNFTVVSDRMNDPISPNMNTDIVSSLHYS